MNKSVIIKTIAISLFMFTIFLGGGKEVMASPQSFVPVKLIQPNGDIIECFASGDEFFNYYHDAEGKLIIKNNETGYYTYAKFENDEFKSTDNIVTSKEMERVNSAYIEGNNHEIKFPIEQINIAKEKYLNKQLRNEIVELVMEKCSDNTLNELKYVIEDFLDSKNSKHGYNEVYLSDINCEHSNSEIIYSLDSKYSRFVSDIGLDDEVSKDASVVFMVFGDGRLLYKSSVMNQNSDTETVDVDITGVNELKLVVNRGEEEINCNHADWADAKLIGAEE